MIRSTSTVSQSGLTATELKMILMALRAYQHHAAFRDLHGKIAVLAEVTGGVAQGAMAAALRTSGVGRAAVMG